MMNIKSNQQRPLQVYMHLFHYGIQETMQTPIWAPNAEKHALMFTLVAHNFNLIYFTHLKGHEPGCQPVLLWGIDIDKGNISTNFQYRKSYIVSNTYQWHVNLICSVCAFILIPTTQQQDPVIRQFGCGVCRTGSQSGCSRVTGPPSLPLPFLQMDSILHLQVTTQTMTPSFKVLHPQRKMGTKCLQTIFM